MVQPPFGTRNTVDASSRLVLKSSSLKTVLVSQSPNKTCGVSINARSSTSASIVHIPSGIWVGIVSDRAEPEITEPSSIDMRLSTNASASSKSRTANSQEELVLSMIELNLKLLNHRLLI